MFYYEGQSCPVCGKAFEESDDIVSCPECGAPHHRACWQQEGHCHFADKHGTAEQWKRPEVEEEPEKATDTEPTPEREEEGHRCPHCGKNNPTYSEFCSRCGRPLVEQDWTPPPRSTGAAYTPFHAHTQAADSSVPRDTLLDEDVTVGEAALAVGTNQMYYLPRFERMEKEKKTVSWNWVAFFFPAPWLFYRKAYGAGALVLAVQLVSAVLGSLLMMPYNTQLSAVLQSLMEGTITAQQYTLQYTEVMSNVPLAAYAFELMDMLIPVAMGLFGNYIYRCSVMNRCRSLKEAFPDDYEARLPIEGGVAAGLFAMVLAIGEFLPTMILMWFR